MFRKQNNRWGFVFKNDAFTLPLTKRPCVVYFSEHERFVKRVKSSFLSAVKDEYTMYPSDLELAYE